MKKNIRNLVYSIIDFFTLYKGVKRKINGFTILFPARWSRFYEDGYEKETFNFFKAYIKEGNTVLDIGAHIGLYAAPFAKLVGTTGKVYCFEPTPSTFVVLSKTIQLNKYSTVTAVNAAISDKSGTVTFNLTSDSGEGSNANSIVEINRTKNNVEVKAYSIDDFRRFEKLKIDILKIDVEGAELLALKGAKTTFEQDRPIGILALHPANIIQFGHSLEEIWDVLLNYKLQIQLSGKNISKEYFCSQTLLFDVEFKPN